MVNAAKQDFFDRAKVINAIGKARAKVLANQGALVRRIARRSMRKRNKPSKPGSPPSVHSGELKRLLWYKYDPVTRGVIVGPEKFGNEVQKVPGTLEHGGKSKRTKNTRRADRKVGDSAIVAIAGTSRAKSGRFRNVTSGRTQKTVVGVNGKKRKVAFAKLTTDRMVAHAEKMEEIIYGPKTFPESIIGPRPFMGPALDKSVSKFPDMWKNTIR